MAPARNDDEDLEVACVLLKGLSARGPSLRPGASPERRAVTSGETVRCRRIRSSRFLSDISGLVHTILLPRRRRGFRPRRRPRERTPGPPRATRRELGGSNPRWWRPRERILRRQRGSVDERLPVSLSLKTGEKEGQDWRDPRSRRLSPRGRVHPRGDWHYFALLSPFPPTTPAGFATDFHPRRQKNWRSVHPHNPDP